MLDTELAGLIDAITVGRGDAAGGTLPFPRFGSALDHINFVRIGRMAQFWKPQDGSPGISLTQSVLDLVAGMHGHSNPWMFVVKGLRSRIECWFGLTAPAETCRAWLSSAFPGVRVEDGATLDRADFARYHYGVALTGTPGLRATGVEARHDQVEKLCRGLFGTEWAYVVYSEPVSRSASAKARNLYLEKIWGAQVGEPSRARKHYAELLEAQLKRYDLGCGLGMWATQAALLAGEVDGLGHARATLHAAFSGDGSGPEPFRTALCKPDATRAPAILTLTSAEVALLTRPPAQEFPGYELIDYVRFGVEAGTSPSPGVATVSLGAILDSGQSTGNNLTLPLADLSRHALVVGVTGSGKTNTCFGLLERSWARGKGVPFLVIESAKSEYRALLGTASFPKLKVFTIGDETASPLRVNPFEVPPGILVQTHIDYLKSLFSAAFVLYPPMPYVLEQSLREVYADRGWDLARNTNYRGQDSPRRFPTMSDLVAKVRDVVDRMGYDERITMDVKAGLVARLDQLRSGGGKGPMLDTRTSVPAHVLFGSPCVLELKQLVDDDEKAFVIGLMLIRLYEYYEGGEGLLSPSREGLRHITLIEEAHRLLRNVSTDQGGEVTANPKGRAIEVFANILSEIRAFGEGFLIAEQVPVKLVPDALKNTNLKVVHRLVAEDDRKAVGGTMNLTEAQTRHLMTLGRGEAVVYKEGMQKPVLVAVPLVSAKQSVREVTTNDVRDAPDIRAFWREHAVLRLPFSACADCRASVTGASCASRTAERVDAALRTAFTRLFNALWASELWHPDIFWEFCSIAMSLRESVREPHLTYCLFVELAEAEAERRGVFWGWSHADVESVIERACDLAAALVTHAAEGSKTTEPEGFRELRAGFSKLFDGLLKTDRTPFAGCVACRHRCAYRFEMIRPEWNPVVADFREIFADQDTGDDLLMAVCHAAARDAFPEHDHETLDGAALCFAVQQFSAMQLPVESQAAFSRVMAELFQESASSQDGTSKGS